MAISLVSAPIYTRYPKNLKKQCILCQSRVKFLYPSRKRWIRDFNETFSEVRYKYACTNPNCTLYGHAFNPSINFTLPGKRYSLSVWKWIAREAKKFNSNAAKISQRISDEFNLSISENTIRNIMDEIDCYLTHQIDDKTKKIVSKQGKILLSLDGQQPEDGEDALWLFVDLLSNRVLDIKLLRSADHVTLYKCVDNILREYDAELIGLLSDKQGSIVKMHDKYFPNIPHQYCQFHFLQNIWNFLEVKDSHMQMKLSGVVNHLKMVTVSKTETRKIPNIGVVNYREHFSVIERDLRKLIKSRGKKFEKLRGISSFSRIEKYLKDMDEIWQSHDSENRITKILKKTSTKLHDILETQRFNYVGCNALFSSFQSIRTILNDSSLTRKEIDEKSFSFFQIMWNKIRLKSKTTKKKELRAFLPRSSASFIEIQQQWVRLYGSYRRGLFNYFDFPIPERTNSKMEQKFGQEKMKFIARSGKPKVGHQIRVRGIYELKQQYVSKNEVKNYLDKIEGQYDKEMVEKELILLEERQKKESAMWQNNLGGKQALLDLYSRGKSKKK